MSKYTVIITRIVRETDEYEVEAENQEEASDLCSEYINEGDISEKVKVKNHYSKVYDSNTQVYETINR